MAHLAINICFAVLILLTVGAAWALSGAQRSRIDPLIRAVDTSWQETKWYRDLRPSSPINMPQFAEFPAGLRTSFWVRHGWTDITYGAAITACHVTTTYSGSGDNRKSNTSISTATFVFVPHPAANVDPSRAFDENTATYQFSPVQPGDLSVLTEQQWQAITHFVQTHNGGLPLIDFRWLAIRPATYVPEDVAVAVAYLDDIRRVAKGLPTSGIDFRPLLNSSQAGANR